eukprot:12418768-Karenia_brevis.AAC.1
MAADRERKLRSTWRHMRQMMVGVGRRRVQTTEPTGSTFEVAIQSCSDESSGDEASNYSSTTSTGH